MRRKNVPEVMYFLRGYSPTRTPSMPAKFGLDILLRDSPRELRDRRVGARCHDPSITSDHTRLVSAFRAYSHCRLAAIFGPQHGLLGQPQNQMIVWEGSADLTDPRREWAASYREFPDLFREAAHYPEEFA